MFSRIRNVSDAKREYEETTKRVKSIRQRYDAENWGVNFTFLTLVATKYYEKIALVPEHEQKGDKMLLRFLKSYDNDAKALAKLWDRQNNAIAYLKTHGYDHYDEDSQTWVSFR